MSELPGSADRQRAVAWLTGEGGVSRETLQLLDDLAQLVREGATRQNLVSPSSLSALWTRHIVDSAQLHVLAGRQGRDAGADGALPHWVDIGTGGGFPGLVIAALGGYQVTCVEMRALRVSFLQECVNALGLAARTRIVAGRVETATVAPAEVISARAVASITELVRGARRLSTENTLWLLPRGRSGPSELAQLPRQWQERFHVEPSATDPESLIASGVGSFPEPGMGVAPRRAARGRGRKAGPC